MAVDTNGGASRACRTRSVLRSKSHHSPTATASAMPNRDTLTAAAGAVNTAYEWCAGAPATQTGAVRFAYPSRHDLNDVVLEFQLEDSGASNSKIRGSTRIAEVRRHKCFQVALEIESIEPT